MIATAADLLKSLSHPVAQALIRTEHDQYAAAREAGNIADAWSTLERMHILSQPFLRLHLHAHWLMLRYAIHLKARREALGQALRVALAPLGALTGRLPWGNSGRASVSPFAPMPLPRDMIDTLEACSQSSSRAAAP